MKVLIAAVMVAAAGWADTPVNPDSALLVDFGKRVAAYQQIHKDAEGKMPKLKTTGSQESISSYQHALAKAIREQRKDAHQGDIFSPQISQEFQRLVGLAMQGADAGRIRKSLLSAEPVQLSLAVNDAYPSGIPQQTTPPTLLANLPALPPELEYRLVGKTLILLDAKAKLVVDFMFHAIP